LTYSPGIYAKVAIGLAVAASAAALLAASPKPEAGLKKPAGNGGLSVVEGVPRGHRVSPDAWPSLVHFVHRCAALKGAVTAAPGAHRLPDDDPVLPGTTQITAHVTCRLAAGRTVRFDHRLTVAQTFELFGAD